MRKQSILQRALLRTSRLLSCGHKAGNVPVVKKDGKTYCCEACAQCQAQSDQTLAHQARLAGWVH